MLCAHPPDPPQGGVWGRGGLNPPPPPLLGAKVQVAIRVRDLDSRAAGMMERQTDRPTDRPRDRHRQSDSDRNREPAPRKAGKRRGATSAAPQIVEDSASVAARCHHAQCARPVESVRAEAILKDFGSSETRRLLVANTIHLRSQPTYTHLPRRAEVPTRTPRVSLRVAHSMQRVARVAPHSVATTFAGLAVCRDTTELQCACVPTVPISTAKLNDLTCS